MTKMKTAENKSVCDGCKKKKTGCEFECKEREQERFEAIKNSNEFFSSFIPHGKHRTDYKPYH